MFNAYGYYNCLSSIIDRFGIMDTENVMDTDYPGLSQQDKQVLLCGVDEFITYPDDTKESDDSSEFEAPLRVKFRQPQNNKQWIDLTAYDWESRIVNKCVYDGKNVYDVLGNTEGSVQGLIDWETLYHCRASRKPYTIALAKPAHIDINNFLQMTKFMMSYFYDAVFVLIAPCNFILRQLYGNFNRFRITQFTPLRKNSLDSSRRPVYCLAVFAQGKTKPPNVMSNSKFYYRKNFQDVVKVAVNFTTVLCVEEDLKSKFSSYTDYGCYYNQEMQFCCCGNCRVTIGTRRQRVSASGFAVLIKRPKYEYQDYLYLYAKTFYRLIRWCKTNGLVHAKKDFSPLLINLYLDVQTNHILPEIP